MIHYADGSIANANFSRAKGKATILRMLNLLTPTKQKLLSLDEIRSLIAPYGKETYKGYQVVPLNKIVGSEGRYKDFNKYFMPRYEYLRNRWTSLDKAHQQNIILPPVHLYEAGGAFFVRDGNHRVSVARQLGMHDIDAVVTSLETELTIDETTGPEDLKRQVINIEKKRFYAHTKFNTIIPEHDMCFTAPGRYAEIRKLIDAHGRYLCQSGQLTAETATVEAIVGNWYKQIFLPMIRLIKKCKILRRFPQRTADDLFIWIFRHEHLLKERIGHSISKEDVAIDFSRKFGKGLLRDIIRRFFQRFRKKYKN